MTATCAGPGCDIELHASVRGPHARYCSDRCRKAAARRAEEAAIAVSVPTSVRSFAPRASERFGRRPVCPVDPAHGVVQDWPTARWGFYCPHQAHDGRPKSHWLGEAPATRAFFTTAEVEAGALRSEVDTAVALAGRSTSEQRASAPDTQTPHTAAVAGGA